MRVKFNLIAVVLSLSFLIPHMAAAYTPESPQVRTMIDSAVKALEGSGQHGQLGGECLVCLALYKAVDGNVTKPKTAKRIQDALTRCRRECTVDALKTQPHATYNQSSALIFLCEPGKKGYMAEIRNLVNALVSWQKPHGGWGYAEEEQGDTSQTQYCLMALWEANSIGVQVPAEVFANACVWLLQTQDPSGGWAYHGVPSGDGNGGRIEQHPLIFPSMVVAGLGSVYICADALGFDGVSVPDPAGPIADANLPPAIKLVRVVKIDGKKSYSIKGIDSILVTRAMQDGNRWYRSKATLPQKTSTNPKMIWNFYYLYSTERYKSFREKSEKIKPNPEPGWYNAGVNFLKNNQDAAGAFIGDGSGHPRAGKSVTTAFGVLFLARNTQKTIGKLTEDTLIGNGELNKTSGDISLGKNGRMFSTPISHQIGDLLSLLEEPEVSDEELKKLIKSSIVNFDSKGETRLEQSARLRGLVTHKKHLARLFAVQIMGRTRNLDNVPALIYALDDPDWRVVREARQALRFVSRRIEGFGVPDKEIERSKMREYQTKWTKWYQTIRPDSTVTLADS